MFLQRWLVTPLMYWNGRGWSWRCIFSKSIFQIHLGKTMTFSFSLWEKYVLSSLHVLRRVQVKKGIWRLFSSLYWIISCDSKIKSYVYMHGYIWEWHRELLRNGNPRCQWHQRLSKNVSCTREVSLFSTDRVVAINLFISLSWERLFLFICFSYTSLNIFLSLVPICHIVHHAIVLLWLIKYQKYHLFICVKYPWDIRHQNHH